MLFFDIRDDIISEFYRNEHKPEYRYCGMTYQVVCTNCGFCVSTRDVLAEKEIKVNPTCPGWGE